MFVPLIFILGGKDVYKGVKVLENKQSKNTVFYKKKVFVLKF